MQKCWFKNVKQIKVEHKNKIASKKGFQKKTNSSNYSDKGVDLNFWRKENALLCPWTCTVKFVATCKFCSKFACSKHSHFATQDSQKISSQLSRSTDISKPKLTADPTKSYHIHCWLVFQI